MPESLLCPLLASVLAAIAAGIVGTLTLVRRSTYSAGAVSHACFAGLGLSEFLVAACGITWFSQTLGALLSALAAALFLALTPMARTGKSDAALSAVWAVGMAVGLFFLALAPGEHEAEMLEDGLFGAIEGIDMAGLCTMAFFDAALLAALCLFNRGILSYCFNAHATELRGAPSRFYGTVLALMTALGVVLLVRVVGILLVVALLALPALAARRFSQRLFPRMLWTALLAFVSLVAGLAIARLTGFSQPSVPVVFLAAALAIAFRKK